MPFDIKAAVADMKDRLSTSDAELHRIWDHVLPSLESAAEVGARLTDGPLAAPLEAALGLPPAAHQIIANVMQAVVDEMAKLFPPEPAPAAAEAAPLPDPAVADVPSPDPGTGVPSPDPAIMEV